MVLGTLIACANASALTLVLTQTFGIPIGPLTANLSTIVFVLTLTHMVFMTFNWKHIIEKREMDAEKAWWRAVRGRCFPHFGACSRRSLAFSALCRCRDPAAPARDLRGDRGCGRFRLRRVPLDIISAPGPNIAIGIGVDAMIHVIVWARRHPAGIRSSETWASVCSRLWKPILYSTSVVGAGFAIFMLSGFPPAQRFGFSVVLGTLLAPLPALFLLPWLATVRMPEKVTDRRGRP